MVLFGVGLVHGFVKGRGSYMVLLRGRAHHASDMKSAYEPSSMQI